MDLFLDFNHSDGIWIDGSHRIFEKSEFEDKGFRVKIKPLTRTELRKIRKSSETAKGSDQDIFLPKIFMAQVLDWELKDSNGQPVSFSEDMKKILVENFPVFTNLIAAACLETPVKSAETLEAEVKNL